MNEEQRQAKGDRYRLWAKEDGLSEAIQTIKQGYVDSFTNSHITDTQGRENCYIAIGIVEKIEAHIEIVIGGGKLAAKEIERVKKEQLTHKPFLNLI
jgi:uncharacterized OB-fold protein